MILVCTHPIGVESIVAAYEEPRYRVIESSGSFEVREYAPMIVAEVTVDGDRKEAANRGFRILADFIFGGNSPGDNPSPPVLVSPQEAGDKIPMTAPVIQQREGTAWKVRFYMPGRYTFESLPRPTNRDVTLLEVKGRKMLAIRFSGFWNDGNIEENLRKLRSHASERGIRTIGEPLIALYNPPWTLPFLRRNEILLEISE